MALSLTSLDIINPQIHQSYLLEQNPEIFDLYYNTLPPAIYSFEASNYQSFGSSILGINQIDQILLPRYYNSSHEKEEECNKLLNTFDPNNCNNAIINGVIGENIFMEEAGVFSHPITNHTSYVQENPKQNRVSQKRHIEEGEVQMSKKQCGANRKTEPKVASPSKDTQTLAAKNRRERISERLRVLQELIPNGTKVDLVTMLEKAICYVKYLQSQVKVLETDEFWPGQGGKALDISQVEEAIDAILSSCHKTNNSSDKNQTKIEL